jgi:catechol 2,3-dioxygenase-like lactoylglutathione lyase family enzyme
MSARLFDHIDLRVKNRQAAQRFYAQILPVIGFRVDKSGDKWGLFEAEGDVAVEFLGFTEEPDHRPNGNRIAFWAQSRQAWIKSVRPFARPEAKTSKDPSFALNTALVITPSFSRTRMATSSRSATAKARRRRNNLRRKGPA